jgi:hypothetical protein
MPALSVTRRHTDFDESLALFVASQGGKILSTVRGFREREKCVW